MDRAGAGAISRPTMARTSAARVISRFRHRGHDAPILEDGHGVAQRRDLIEAMGDVEDRHVSVHEFTDELEQSLRLSRGEGCGGLVHRDQLGATDQGSTDGDFPLRRDR